MANPNVGHVLCPIQNELSVVRRDCRGKLYYYSQAGKITPNLPQGQEWLQRNAELWENPNQPPSNVELKTLVNGAPPQVIINAVKRVEPTESEPEIPLTPKAEPLRTNNVTKINVEKEQKPAPKAKKVNALSYLLNLGGDDNE